MHHPALIRRPAGLRSRLRLRRRLGRSGERRGGRERRRRHQRRGRQQRRRHDRRGRQQRDDRRGWRGHGGDHRHRRHRRHRRLGWQRGRHGWRGSRRERRFDRGARRGRGPRGGHDGRGRSRWRCRDQRDGRGRSRRRGGTSTAGAGGRGGAAGTGTAGTTGAGGCAANPPPPSELIGWASLSGGTTGGGTATPQVVTTLAQFTTAVMGTTPAVIYVNGVLAAGRVRIGSNKTIVGVCGAEFRGHLTSTPTTGVIIRNLKIVGYGVGNCADPAPLRFIPSAARR